MVTDILENAHLYLGLGGRLARALGHLQTTDFGIVEPGRQDLDGQAIYVMVSDYLTRPEPEGRWEAHRRYIDLQFVVRGTERIGVSPIGRLAAGEYDEKKDVTWLTGTGDFITLGARRFIILWPEDAHMPGIAAGAPAEVRKVVIKVAVD